MSISQETARIIFALNLRRQMTVSDLNQADLARYAGVTQAAICRYCAGHRLPRADTLARMAKALGCSSSALLKGLAD